MDKILRRERVKEVTGLPISFICQMTTLIGHLSFNFLDKKVQKITWHVLV